MTTWGCTPEKNAQTVQGIQEIKNYSYNLRSGSVSTNPHREESDPKQWQLTAKMLDRKNT
jgi:hypothetical protein